MRRQKSEAQHAVTRELIHHSFWCDTPVITPDAKLSPLDAQPVDSASKIVESMTLLMRASLVDGEEASTIESDYVQATCLVTSSTDRMSFVSGKRSSALVISTIFHQTPRVNLGITGLPRL